MRTSMVTKALRRWWVPALVALLLLGACSSEDSPDDEPTSDAVTVEVVSEDQPARLTLRQDAVERLGIETAPVASLPGKPARLAVPYAAVIYDADGRSWSFSNPAPRTYIRVPVTIESVDADTAVLSAGPRVGTKVVVVGASELVGAEAGISGEE
jgi:hypothetical protein